MPHARPLTNLTFEVVVDFFPGQRISPNHEWRQHVHLATGGWAGHPVGDVLAAATIFSCDGDGIFGGANGGPFFISNELPDPCSLLVRGVKLKINDLDGFDAAHWRDTSLVLKRCERLPSSSSLRRRNE